MFEKALEYLKKYRTRKCESLNNEKRNRWFASDAATIAELTSSVFDSTQENVRWSELYNQPHAKSTELQAIRTKLDFVVCCRHDLRTQFAAGAAHEPRLSVNVDRHAFMQLMGATFRTSAIERYVKNLEGVQAK